MTQVDRGSAALPEARGLHLARDQGASELSDVSFASTLTDAQDSDFTTTLQSEASTANLIDNGAKPSYSSWADAEHSFDQPNSSVRSVGTSIPASHRGKQPSNGHYVDLEHPKLSTIDETSAASASSYKNLDLYNSSANGYVQYDAADRHQTRSRQDSHDSDEAPYTTSTYPPTSEEDSEAKRVQQNLERWAAEERQRRKAQRTSKIISNRNSTVATGTSLTHRLSMLRSSGFTAHTHNRLGSGPSSERLADAASASPSMPYHATLGDRRRDASARRESGASSTSGGGGGGAARGLHRPASPSSFESSHSHGSLVSDDQRPNKELPQIGSRVSSATHGRNVSGDSAGSSRDYAHRANGGVRDPFRDPSEGVTAESSNPTSHKRSSLKPTPTALRPIVTVGRASSIQRQALEASHANSKGKGKGRSMPTIVATDTEAEAESEDHEFDSRYAGDNPFASNQDHQKRTRTTSTTIHQGGLDEEVAMGMSGRGKGLDANGDLGESSLDAGSAPRPPPTRTSTSSSKFRELGITEGDDWIDTLGQSMGRPRRAMRVSRQAASDDDTDGARKPWWTELLCGCNRDLDDDEQV
ncbi:hypothetical protein PHSY_005681 [Pseudozyma hubeiensis SY62]|uniref:Uncharacterized protein n=1 Tax=Pseudozyma hubeiensis (strain SY62) TaxID=1305764 RepID=R9PA11_PSEHS|nr:hypothetical protein PHSY_005681 [Pseudozyma hubeiensis SY62]GAC98092.1 hypothetical protein PHSY_005681 [Pseudozyma hubeiensis SY62]